MHELGLQHFPLDTREFINVAISVNKKPLTITQYMQITPTFLSRSFCMVDNGSLS